VNIADFGDEDKTSSADESDDTTEDSTDNVPFIGVVSGSKSKSVIAYYGIENHSKWLFTPLFRGTNARSITGAPRLDDSVDNPGQGGGGIKNGPPRPIRDQ
jgi:hypothetical protein